MKFKEVFEALGQGKKVSRTKWNDAYVKRIGGHPVDEFFLPVTNDNQKVVGQMLNFYVMKLEGPSRYHGEGFGDFVPWTPTNEDMEAEDWVILD